MGSKRPKLRVSQVFPKTLPLPFSGFDVKWKFILSALVHIISFMLAQIPCMENSGSWVISQNALSQLECRILTAISQEKNDESTWSVACRYRFKKRKRWFVNF